MLNFFLSYFAGCGGASLGAKAAGCETLGVELDSAIADLYRTNVGNVVVADVTQFNPIALDFPSWDERRRTSELLIWQLSPPCQDYSRANTKANKQSSRATILQEIIWHEEIIKPDIILVENVGEYQYSEAFNDFCIYLRERKYKILSFILNAADFGVPQSRDRLIGIAIRSGLPLPQITTTHEQYPTLGQLNLFGENPKKRWVGWYEAIAGSTQEWAITDLIPELPESKLTNKQKEAIRASEIGFGVSFQPVLVASDNSKSTKAGYKTRVGEQSSFTIRTLGAPKALLVERLGYYYLPKTAASVEPCWTLRASLADDSKGGSRTKLIDAVFEGVEVRSLNTKALARLQSFPDTYQWSGRSAVDVRGIGNSVPPLMMQRIIESIGEL